MLKIIFPERFSILKTFAITYLIFSLIVRTILYVYSFSEIDFSIINTFKIFLIGFLFDLGSLSYILMAYSMILLLLPKILYGTRFDKIINKFVYFTTLFVIIFSFLGEINFWKEYGCRYNFIAVDYLLYTYEVVQNIHEAVPLPLLILVILLICYFAFRFAKKKKAFHKTFFNDNGFIKKLIPTVFWVIIFTVFHLNIKNNQAEVFSNYFENELSKAGMYSFFAAYHQNELNYNEFYKTLDSKDLSSEIADLVMSSNDSLIAKTSSIQRMIFNDGIEKKPNIIFICLESMNSRFMKRFGNEKSATNTLDSIAEKSILFTNLYATGTRTIRGLEALTLSIPPTPGRSIIKRKNNKNLFTIGEIFKEKGYSRTFFYGGDGYFDDMNIYFGNNGFDIVDRKKKHRTEKDFPTKRIQIIDDEVTFENAWGACDGDLLNKVIQIADEQHKLEKPFFNFVMTGSNHHPYTYPEGIIDIPSGEGRLGAIKYSDESIKKFLNESKQKPWFENTVFVFVSDHCAYSAGKTELNVKSYQIPGFIYNLKGENPVEINKLSSQIDVFPTLFGYLNWTYTSNFFGKDIRKMQPNEERALIANHRKLGLLKGEKVVILDEYKNQLFYNWNPSTNTLNSSIEIPKMGEESIIYYQSSYDMLKNGELQSP